MLIESRVAGLSMRLKFVEPLLPTLVEISRKRRLDHEVKFDGYRSQTIIDNAGYRS